jgi:hypothetical protein
MNLILEATGIKTEYGQGKDTLIIWKETLQFTTLLSFSCIILIDIYYTPILLLLHDLQYIEWCWSYTYRTSSAFLFQS